MENKQTKIDELEEKAEKAGQYFTAMMRVDIAEKTIKEKIEIAKERAIAEAEYLKAKNKLLEAIEDAAYEDLAKEICVEVGHTHLEFGVNHPDFIEQRQNEINSVLFILRQNLITIG